MSEISDERVQSISPESKERLYVVNQIRDRLHKYGHELELLDVVEVVGFGSSVNGIASKKSDIDIAVLSHHESVMPYNEYSDLVKRLKKFLQIIFSGLPYKASFSQEGDKSKIIHINLDSYISDQEYPDYIEQPLKLWSR